MRGLVVYVYVAVVLLLAACSRSTSAGTTSGPPALDAGRADIGGYSLAYQCEGQGSPTVILEAGYTASGIGTFGAAIQPALAQTTRVCTYDRAGVGTSDPRPRRVRPLTATTQAIELHALLDSLGEHGPFALVGHSYGGIVVRAFASRYPGEVAGMVLLDASSEAEIPVYDRLHAGAWVDGTVHPAPNQKIDIHATVRDLELAPSLGDMPLVVVTAGILEDPWLATVPRLEARAQARLAGLSTDGVHVLDEGKGHFLPDNDPAIVIAATLAAVDAARSAAPLGACDDVFADVATARCLAAGELGRQEVRPSG